MEQNQGVDEILRCLRVSFLQLYNLFLSQPHKDERFMWESCQQNYNFTGKFGLKKTWLIWQLTWSYPRCWPVLFLHSRVALVKVSALRTLYFIGIKEVAWNVNLRARNLYPDYSNSFILSNASELFLSRISSLPRERNLSCRLFTSSIKREIRHFPVVVVQWRQRNVQKKRDARAELLFCLFKLLLFLTFSLSSPSWHLKVPNDSQCTEAPSPRKKLESPGFSQIVLLFLERKGRLYTGYGNEHI